MRRLAWVNHGNMGIYQTAIDHAPLPRATADAELKALAHLR